MCGFTFLALPSYFMGTHESGINVQQSLSNKGNKNRIYISLNVEQFLCYSTVTVSVGSFVTELSAPPDGLLQEKIQGLLEGGNDGLRRPDNPAASSRMADCSQRHQLARSDRQTFKQTVAQMEEKTPEDPQTPQRYDTATTRKTQLPFTGPGSHNVCKYFPAFVLFVLSATQTSSALTVNLV